MLLLACVFAGAGAASVTAGPFETAVVDPYLLTGSGDRDALRKIKAAGATVVRLTADWSAVAPAGPTRPAGFADADPSDPGYSWVTVDAQVRSAVAAGLEPLVDIAGAPQWAQRGTAPQGRGSNYPSA